MHVCQCKYSVCVCVIKWKLFCLSYQRLICYGCTSFPFIHLKVYYAYKKKSPHFTLHELFEASKSYKNRKCQQYADTVVNFIVLDESISFQNTKIQRL